MDDKIPEYVDALSREIEFVGRSAGSPIGIKTVFFGGGTPSLLSPDQLGIILESLRKPFTLTKNAEITLEANPGTVSQEYFRELRRLGFNRISLGVQSSQPEYLKLLGRTHSYPDAINAFYWARKAGFDNISIDLIMSLPEQTLRQWRQDFQQCIELEPDHISIYSLIVERGTPFYTWMDKGTLSVPDDDVGADMFQYAMDTLADRGYQHYEISNWSKTTPQSPAGFPSLHNLQYWLNKPYIGFGAGAHGYNDGLRTVNYKSPRRYIQSMKVPGSGLEFPRSPVTEDTITIDREAEIKETLMMGLRLIDEGVSNQTFESRFGDGIEDHFEKEIRYLQDAGLVYWSKNGGDQRLCLTQKGVLLGNQVFLQFI